MVVVFVVWLIMWLISILLLIWSLIMVFSDWFIFFRRLVSVFVCFNVCGKLLKIKLFLVFCLSFLWIRLMIILLVIKLLVFMMVVIFLFIFVLFVWVLCSMLLVDSCIMFCFFIRICVCVFFFVLGGFSKIMFIDVMVFCFVFLICVYYVVVIFWLVFCIDVLIGVIGFVGWYLC